MVVAGAGPAGCAAAIVLARAGKRVLIADPSANAPRFKVGETLPAVAGAALRDLGIGPELIEFSGGRRSTGIVSAWGEDRPLTSDSIMDAGGQGWHLDRARFDALLLERARAAGAEVRAVRASVVPPDSAESPDWQPRLIVGGEPVAARRVIDATGRSAALARRLGARRVHADRLVAAFARVRTAPTDLDARTRIEATPSGWWYSALVAEGRRVVAFLTDADLLELRSSSRFADALGRTCHVLPLPGRPELESPVQITAAHGMRLAPAAGTGWVAVGDAAVAFDPLSSQGILNGLVTGSEGASAVLGSLSGAGEAHATYEKMLRRVWAAYELNRAEAYALERRWTTRPFWARRQPIGAARPVA